MTTATRPTDADLEAARKHPPIDPSKVREEDYMQVVHFVKVVRNDRGERLAVVDIDTGLEFGVNGPRLIERCLSADQYAKEVAMSRTKVVEILETCYNTPFTVCFDKQPDKSGKVVERTLRGRLIKAAPFGRSIVEDIDITKGTPIREVDHRTLKWLIVRGVKYVVNSK